MEYLDNLSIPEVLEINDIACRKAEETEKEIEKRTREARRGR